MTMEIRETLPVLRAVTHALSWGVALSRISAWAANLESRYVCIGSAHSVVTAGQDTALGQMVAQTDRERHTLKNVVRRFDDGIEAALHD